jgi:hypothetical protein
VIAEITIQTEDGPETVTALQFGFFAIHPMRARRGHDCFGYYTVTHIPTGLAIASTDRLFKGRAISSAYEVLPINWSHADPAIYQPSVPTMRAVYAQLVTDGIVVPDGSIKEP